MTRQIVLDTETTGLNAKTGDRIIEIGCIEIIDRRVTSNHLHFYINPERNIDPGAQAIHGLSREFLSDKPRFADIAETFREFIAHDELIIHNAPFDLGFLNAEFERLGWAPVTSLTHPAGGSHSPSGNSGSGSGSSSSSSGPRSIIDTLLHARELFPGRKNSLDALCERFNIDNTHRTLHGALMDAQLLAEVYLTMTRGQELLFVDSEKNQAGKTSTAANGAAARALLQAVDLPVLQASAEELRAHQGILAAMREQSVWKEASTQAISALSHQENL